MALVQLAQLVVPVAVWPLSSVVVAPRQLVAREPQEPRELLRRVLVLVPPEPPELQEPREPREPRELLPRVPVLVPPEVPPRVELARVPELVLARPEPVQVLPRVLVQARALLVLLVLPVLREPQEPALRTPALLVPPTKSVLGYTRLRAFLSSKRPLFGSRTFVGKWCDDWPSRPKSTRT